MILLSFKTFIAKDVCFYKNNDFFLLKIISQMKDTFNVDFFSRTKRTKRFSFHGRSLKWVTFVPSNIKQSCKSWSEYTKTRTMDVMVVFTLPLRCVQPTEPFGVSFFMLSKSFQVNFERVLSKKAFR